MSSRTSRPDEPGSKPNRVTIAAMRIVWGDTPIVPVVSRNRENVDKADLNIWRVPSENTSKRYVVNLKKKTCSCPFWRDKKVWCKHLEAARYWKAATIFERDPHTNVQLIPVPNPYKQESWYDSLVAKEELLTRRLARCLGLLIPDEVPKRGRPSISLGDILVCGILAAYNNRPSRRAITYGTEDLIRRGTPPAPQTLRKAMLSEEVTDASRKALKSCALCTRQIDSKFSLDATYMKTPLSKIHLERRGKGLKLVRKILNCKVHVAIGIDTFMAYGVDVTDGEVNDQASFIETLEQFESFVRLDMVLADAGYDAAAHYEYVGERGGRPIINMSDIPGRGPQPNSPYYNEAFELWKAGDPDWFALYKFRWLSESANSSLKRTVKRVIRARLETSRENEVLFAILAWNLKWLIHARATHKIEIPWADEETLSIIDGVVEKNRLWHERRNRRAA